MDRDELIRQYAAGPDQVRAAVAGLTDAELDLTPPAEVDPDGWTARQTVHHLADSEMTSAIRLRDSGTYGVEDWLGIYAAHAKEHAEQIARAVGRPLP